MATTITCKISDELNDLLEEKASNAMQSKSAIVREALQHSLEVPKQNQRVTAYDQIKDLCGLIEDGPEDMSTNPKYMDGFGE